MRLCSSAVTAVFICGTGCSVAISACCSCGRCSDVGVSGFCSFTSSVVSRGAIGTSCGKAVAMTDVGSVANSCGFWSSAGTATCTSCSLGTAARPAAVVAPSVTCMLIISVPMLATGTGVFQNIASKAPCIISEAASTATRRQTLDPGKDGAGRSSTVIAGSGNAGVLPTCRSERANGTTLLRSANDDETKASRVATSGVPGPLSLRAGKYARLFTLHRSCCHPATLLSFRSPPD